MSRPTAALTRLSGLVLVVVLSVVSTPGSTPALGTPGEPDPVGVWPLLPRPEVVEGFDPPAEPWGPGHRGVDLLGSSGQPVRTALAGRVSFAGLLAGRGVVVVDHGDTRTTYEPVSASVAVGDRVAAGDRLGRLAPAGSHCLPRACLHWGWLRGDVYLDPLGLVGGGPVRLLPLWRDEPLGDQGRAWSAPVQVTPYAAWRPMVAGLETPVLVSTRRSRLRSSLARLARPPTADPLTRLCYARGWACW